ncbi:TPA: dimethyl sulfoxide reductase anchor subunit [Escherichia coli]|nr:dimethyl sulfoxide reductase anchor subunit [Escherichia coli]HDT2451778.1 dimethyl sulfoxide reductase anchor subunit [Escherichia coli]HDT2950320.1 dimethyl sulfoxide reductase anchor subunit [Escherichia coli]
MTATRDGVRGKEKLDVPIKFLWCYASNTLINQHGDINHTHEVLQDDSKCEMIVGIDHFMTASAKYCDILLPDLMPTEQEDLISHESAGNMGYVILAQPATSAKFERKPIYWMLSEVAKRLGPDVYQTFTEGRSQHEWIKYLHAKTKERNPEMPDYEEMKTTGIFKKKCPEEHYVAFRAFRVDPQANPLKTPSGKIEIYSERLGALIVSGIGWFAAKNDADRQHIIRGMFFLWLLMGIGFIASVMHLGSPLRAFNSLNRIGASGLSNEIAAGSIFFAVGGLWWLVAVIGKMPQALGKLWLLVSMALGIIFVWMMTCVYQIDTVPTWHNGYTTLAFFLTVLLSGPILAATILRAARVTFNTTPFAIISILALIACAGLIVLQGLSLASIHSSVQQASALVPDYASLQVWRVVLLCAGLGCWLCPLIRRREPHVAGLVLGLILILGGEMIGRVLFYGLHMTVGMAIAG